MSPIKYALSSSPSTQRRRVGGGRGLLVNSIHGVDTLRYVVVHSGLSYTCFTEVLSSYAILYRLSTSNYNIQAQHLAHHLIILYRLSTSNHNWTYLSMYSVLLSYIVFLHQTTTLSRPLPPLKDCFISSFYFKPQLMVSST